MDLEIISGIAYLAIIAITMGRMCVKWMKPVNKDSKVIKSYIGGTNQFFPEFLRLNKYLTKRQWRKLPKAILYYLAQKGLLEFHIEADCDVILLRTGDADNENAAEKYLLDIIFADSYEYMVDKNATIGMEAVKLKEINGSYSMQMLSCPIGSTDDLELKATIGNPGEMSTIDENIMKRDDLAAWGSSFILVISLIINNSITYIETDGFGVPFISQIILAFVLGLPIIFSAVGIRNYRNKKKRNWFSGASKEFNEAINALRAGFDWIILVISSIVAIFLSIFLGASESDTVLTGVAAAVGCTAILVIWIVTKMRESKKEKVYSEARNVLRGFASFIKGRKWRFAPPKDSDEYAAIERKVDVGLIGMVSLLIIIIPCVINIPAIMIPAVIMLVSWTIIIKTANIKNSIYSRIKAAVMKFILKRIGMPAYHRENKQNEENGEQLYLPDDIGNALPFMSLFGSSSKVAGLLEEKGQRLPNWIHSEREMDFRAADELIRDSMKDK